MKNLILVSIVTLILGGCKKPDVLVLPPTVAKPLLPVGKQWSGAVLTDDKYTNFIKTWYIQMTPSIVLEVTSTYRPWLEPDCKESCTFEFVMQQGDNHNKWVDFNCDAVAEKIIQSDLVPIAQQDCILLRNQGYEYWKNHADPDEYTDSKGRTWRRQ